MYDKNFNLKKVNKKKTKDYFCPCCRSQRTIRYSRRLTAIHFGQILMLSVAATAIGYSWIEWKGALCFPIIWAIFETIHSSLYRKDLNCPYCGFDATWYKKDVKIARAKVEEFLKQNPDTPLLRRQRQNEKTNSILN